MYVCMYIGVQGLKTGYVSNGQGKRQTGDVESIFVGSIVENLVRIACRRVQSRKNGVDKTLVIRAFYVYNRHFVFQPLWRFEERAAT